MTARPWNPRIELDEALQRGDLSYAITLAAEVAEDAGRPIDLDTALRFLPLIAREPPRVRRLGAQMVGPVGKRDAGRDDRAGSGGRRAAR